MLTEEVLDDRQAAHEGAGKVWEGCRTDDHQQSDAVAHDGIALVRLVADAAVMAECDPAVFANRFEPYFVGSVVGKMIGVSLDP